MYFPFCIGTHLAIYHDTVANEVPHRRQFVIPSPIPLVPAHPVQAQLTGALSTSSVRSDNGSSRYRCTIRGSDARAPRSTIIIPIEHTRVACRTPRHRASHRGVHSFMLGPLVIPRESARGCLSSPSRDPPLYIIISQWTILLFPCVNILTIYDIRGNNLKLRNHSRELITGPRACLLSRCSSRRPRDVLVAR